MKQVIAGKYDSPPSIGQNPDKSNISEEIIYNLIDTLTDIIDTQINKRFQQSDIMQYYDAPIYKVTNDNFVEVEINDQYVSAANGTGIAFSDAEQGQYVTVGTCDHVNYVVLYRLNPKSINVNELKDEIIKLVNQNTVKNNMNAR